MLHPYSGECIVGLLAEAGKSFLTLHLCPELNIPDL